MGKPFANELAALEGTLEWARASDVRGLERFAADVRGMPLVAVGSGGSATACHLVSLLHRARHDQPAQFTTPLDVLAIPAGLHRSGVFLASASGKNKDALAALKACVADEAPAVGAVILRTKSALGELAASYPRTRVFSADLPTGKDGYLATNSLVATCTLVSRGYGFEIPGLKNSGEPPDATVFDGRHMVQVLHGGWGAPVATDLESKLNESSLAAAQLADYRNFGHGRHLWLSRRAAETVVIALITPGTAAIARSTLKHIPAQVPVVRLETSFNGPAGALDLLLQACHLVGRIGEVRGEDPGRPHVPDFGRKLYRLAPPRSRRAIEPAIHRKLWASPSGLNATKAFRDGLKRFLERIGTARIGAVALDYDGTLCSKDERFSGLRDDLVAECSRLLGLGVRIGIATGRGKSVRAELQRVLAPATWPFVQIGYYNGTQMSPLNDDASPKTHPPSSTVLKRALALLSSDAWLAAAAEITPRPHQLTVEPKGETHTEALAAHVMARLAPVDGTAVRIVVSSHSLDVLGPRPGKGMLVSWLREHMDQDLDVLCIGDRGSWPGNDYALLAEPLSLSVDEVSSLDDSCWNLAPRGVFGPDATLLYLRALEARSGVGRFVWKEGASR